MKTKILQIINANTEIFAVYNNADPFGKSGAKPICREQLLLTKCSVIALIEDVTDEGNDDLYRMVKPMTLDEDGFNLPSDCTNFMGYANSEAEADRLFLANGRHEP
jgi:hypothetical protein